MLQYPNIDPIALALGPVKIHWYGLMYLLGFALAWLLAHWRSIQKPGDWQPEQITDLIFYAALGVVIGGRVGYILLYNFSDFLADPLMLFKVWQGGMSFHGGLLGVITAFWLYGHKINKDFFQLSDFIAPMVPIGLGLGRIGNFINGELWGRTTEMPWGMIFSSIDNLPRHPSQLYEFLLEGVLLFIILWIYSSKHRPRMAVSGLFLLLYGIFRFIAELFRQPDLQMGFVAFNWLTMGQLLSLPMILLGIVLWIMAYRSLKSANN